MRFFLCNLDNFLYRSMRSNTFIFSFCCECLRNLIFTLNSSKLNYVIVVTKIYTFNSQLTKFLYYKHKNGGLATVFDFKTVPTKTT